MKTLSFMAPACFLAALLHADPPLPVDLDHWIWRNPLPTGAGLENVVFANNVFLAMESDYDSDTLLTSTDGTNWTGRWIEKGTPLESAAYGNGTFVAVGGGGRIMTSPDAAIWNKQNSGTDLGLVSVSFGAGVFVAVGGDGVNLTSVVLTSTDGALWTQRSSGTTRDLYAVTFAQGIFVAVGYDNNLAVILTSPDGENWSQRYSSINQSFFHGVTFGNGKFVVVGQVEVGNGSSTPAILTSPDGVTWTQQTSPAGYIRDITFGNGTFVGVSGCCRNGSTFISSNGMTWIEHLLGGDGDHLSRVTFGNGTFVGVSDLHSRRIRTSSDGVTWTPPGSNVTINQLTAVASGNGLSVAVGYATIVTSPDGANWTPQQYSVTNAYLDGITYGDGKFVAVGTYSTAFGAGDLILTSPDGISWSRWSSDDPGNGNGRLSDVTYANGTFVAVGSRRVGDWIGTIVTSLDGTNWTEQSAATPGLLYGVGYGNGVFVAVGWNADFPLVLTSSDGTTWTPRSAGTNASLSSLNSIAYCNGLFVAAGSDNFGRRSFGVTSPDGITWTAQAEPYPRLNCISFGNGTFVGVAGRCSDGACDGHILTSPDGVTWTPHYSAASFLSGVTFGHGSFIVVGDHGTILQSGTVPQFQRTAQLGDGTMHLVLEAQTGAELLLDASTNLVHWARLATLTNSLGTVSHLDLATTNFNHRFYRARQISK